MEKYEDASFRKRTNSLISRSYHNLKCVNVERIGWNLLLNFVEAAWTDLDLCSVIHAYKIISADPDW
jgi:hypothetical protein